MTFVLGDALASFTPLFFRPKALGIQLPGRRIRGGCTVIQAWWLQLDQDVKELLIMLKNRVVSLFSLPVCDVCCKDVSDLRRHKARRCFKIKGKRRTGISPAICQARQRIRSGWTSSLGARGQDMNTRLPNRQKTRLSHRYPLSVSSPEQA